MIMWVFVRRSWCPLDGLHQVMFTKLRSHGLRLSVFTVLIILVCIYCSRNINHNLQRSLINHSRRHNKSRLWFITHPSNWKNPSRLHFLSYSLHCAEIFINRERRGNLWPVKTSEFFFPEPSPVFCPNCLNSLKTQFISDICVYMNPKPNWMIALWSRLTRGFCIDFLKIIDIIHIVWFFGFNAHVFVPVIQYYVHLPARIITDAYANGLDWIRPSGEE